MQNDELDQTQPSRLDTEGTGLDETQLSAAQSDSNLNTTETNPTPTTITMDAEDTDQTPVEGAPQNDGRRIWVRGVIIGLIIFAVIVGGALFGGYATGNRAFETTQTLEVAIEANIQFERAKADYEAGRNGAALQRLEWIAKHAPGFPGLTEELAKVLLAINQSSGPATATTESTPTIEPTPDTRGQEELFQGAVELKNAEDWTALLETLNSLRANYPDYRAVEVDGMYYIAFRQRGAKNILIDGNLEPGIYDLNQAARFGPLDAEAQSYRQWAEYYIAGAANWEINWGEVIAYFSELVISAPNLYDSSYFTASQRLATAQVEYGYQLVIQADSLMAQKHWCDALEIYRQAQDYTQSDVEFQATLQPALEFAVTKCELNPDE